MEELKDRLISMKYEIINKESKGLIANSIYVRGYISAIDDVLATIEDSELECVCKNIFGD